MQYATFKTICDVELNDKVRPVIGAVTEIVDIRAIHYVKDRRVEFEFELGSMPGYWCKRKDFVYPVPPIDARAEWVLPKTTFEGCSNCGNEVEIPGNEQSKCPKCNDDILPCSTCYDEIDGKKQCDWDEDSWCWRLPKAGKEEATDNV